MHGVVRALILIVCSIGVADQWLKGQKHLNECREHDRKNRLVLEQEICKDPITRLQLDGKYVQCSKAEMELKMDPWTCAVRRWWKHGALMHFYGLLTESTIMFLGFLVCVLTVIAWGITRCFTTQNAERQRLDAFKEMMRHRESYLPFGNDPQYALSYPYPPQRYPSPPPIQMLEPAYYTDQDYHRRTRSLELRRVPSARRVRIQGGRSRRSLPIEYVDDREGRYSSSEESSVEECGTRQVIWSVN